MEKYARKNERKPILRRHVPWTVSDKITAKTCLHVDIWLVQDQDDTLYFVVQTRRGGWDVLATRVFRATPGELIPTQYNGAEMVQHMIHRRIDDAWGRRRGWLNELHWSRVYPALRQPMEGFKGYQSVALHYVHSDPSVTLTTEDAYNGYGASGRAARDMAMSHNPTPLPEQLDISPPARFDARSRSILRTLDKILKA